MRGWQPSGSFEILVAPASCRLSRGRPALALAGKTPAPSGSQKQAKIIYLEELGMHPSGEHMLGELYKLGYAIRLVRCGPVYTESPNNWYSVSSGKTRPFMLQQSIRYEGKRVQDSYELRPDATLPKRDPRDRDPGVGGCK